MRQQIVNPLSPNREIHLHTTKSNSIHSLLCLRSEEAAIVYGTHYLSLINRYQVVSQSDYGIHKSM